MNLDTIKWYKDLQWFDGPLSSLFLCSETKGHYLFHWCDCTKDHNIWLAQKIKEEDISPLLEGRKSFLSVFQPEEVFYLVGIDSEGSFCNCNSLQWDDIPLNYLPSPFSRVLSDLMP